jgi:acetoin utilization deacetylase AcuC-like enzyme
MAHGVLFHDRLFYEHKPWFNHPENPGRLKTIVAALKRSRLWELFDTKPAPPNRDETLALLVHEDSYVREVKLASKHGRYMLDPDTYVAESTFEAALAVLASTVEAVELVSRGFYRLALVLGRPPGHHAGRNGPAMGAPTLGFCIFNASALASKLLADRGYRVLHVDFDLHHGNGTQEILYDEPRVVHLDIHQDPSTIYPGTGWPWQTGEGEAKGTKINIVLPPGAGDDAFEKAIEVFEALVAELNWHFDYLVFSAGFDAYSGDGLGLLHATTSTYTTIAHRLLELVKPRGVIVVWEGGYSIGLERGSVAFISALLGHEPPVSDEPTTSSRRVLEALKENLEQLCRYLDLDPRLCRGSL